MAAASRAARQRLREYRAKRDFKSTPEPSGEEGLQDVRIVEALYESARRGRPIQLRPFRKTQRPTGRQRISRPGIAKPRLIKVQSASRD